MSTAPHPKKLRSITKAIEPVCLRIGKFALSRMKDGGIWIQHSDGPREGDGGWFDEAKLEAVIRKFYVKHF